MSHRRLSDIDLDAIHGGASAPLYAEVSRQNPDSWWGRPTWSHQYAMYGQGLGDVDYATANLSLQRFNAPTFDVLRGGGNDPTLTRGEIHQETVPGGLVDRFFGNGFHGPARPHWGGDVTLQHHDGWVRNVTEPQHPLTGQISRHLVHDTRDGQFHVLTSGVGQGGGYRQPELERDAHVFNPGLGFQVFSEVDAAHRRSLGLPDSFDQNVLAAARTSAQLGWQLDGIGANPFRSATARIDYPMDPTTALLRDTAQHLEGQGGINGAMSINIDGTISRFNPDGTRDTFTRDPSNPRGVLPLPYDEFRGVQQAMEHWGPGSPTNPVVPSNVMPAALDALPLPEYPTAAPVIPGADAPASPEQQPPGADFQNYQDLASPPAPAAAPPQPEPTAQPSYQPDAPAPAAPAPEPEAAPAPEPEGAPVETPAAPETSQEAAE